MLIGKRISGRYKILDMVGGGGMANVYLAHDMILDRDVAVKILRLDFANDEEFIRRFHREAQSATSLVHPNIVNIYDVGEENDIYYIVMEYVEGQTLKQYIQKNSPLDVDEALGIMKQLTSAISHAHHNHIVHRDIKPHNILVDNKGTVKITDFGIAMALSATSITQTNSVMGSVHYLSPEQARGGMANKKSDIYSLGIVMFELLTGRLPFSGESAVSIALKHLQSETPSVRRWNPNIPQSVENIVLKATAKDPFHRYNSVDEMGEDLQTSLYPNRINEPKFSIPEDDEATKAIPIITNDRPFQNLDYTLVHSNDKKNGKMDTKQEPVKKKRKKWPLVLVSIFIILVLLAVGTVTVFPKWFAPKDVTVPDVSGMELDKAVEKLAAEGFMIGKTRKMPDDQRPEGQIIKTDPNGGDTAKEGSKITLYQSIGKEKLEMDDFKDRDIEEVQALLKDKNFKDVEQNEVYDDSEPGTILSQDPEAGIKVVPEDTVVTFEVSKGPRKIAVKDLSAYNSQTLKDYADSTGLVIDMSQKAFSDKIPEDMVISQDPPAGTELEKGDTVKVVLSKGQEEIPPKPVTKDVTINYEPAIPGQPQQVKIFIEDMEHDSMTEPVETFTITKNEQRTLRFMVQYGKQAGYQIIRDNEVIDQGTVDYPK